MANVAMDVVESTIPSDHNDLGTRTHCTLDDIFSYCHQVPTPTVPHVVRKVGRPCHAKNERMCNLIAKIALLHTRDDWVSKLNEAEKTVIKDWETRWFVARKSSGSKNGTKANKPNATAIPLIPVHHQSPIAVSPDQFSDTSSITLADSRSSQMDSLSVEEVSTNVAPMMVVVNANTELPRENTKQENTSATSLKSKRIASTKRVARVRSKLESDTSNNASQTNSKPAKRSTIAYVRPSPNRISTALISTLECELLLKRWRLSRDVKSAYASTSHVEALSNIISVEPTRSTAAHRRKSAVEDCARQMDRLNRTSQLPLAKRSINSSITPSDPASSKSLDNKDDVAQQGRNLLAILADDFTVYGQNNLLQGMVEAAPGDATETRWSQMSSELALSMQTLRSSGTDLDMCTHCGSLLTISVNRDYRICYTPHCGARFEIRDNTADMVSFGEEFDFLQVKSQCTINPTNALKWAAIVLGRAPGEIKQSIVDWMSSALALNCSTRASDLYCANVFSIVKRCKFKDLEMHCTQIYARVVGCPIPTLTREQELRSYAMLLQFLVEFARSRPSSRRNLINSPYVWFKIWQLMGLDHLLKFIYLPRADKIGELDEIWRVCCQSLDGWTFMPTDTRYCTTAWKADTFLEPELHPPTLGCNDRALTLYTTPAANRMDIAKNALVY